LSLLTYPNRCSLACSPQLFAGLFAGLAGASNITDIVFGTETDVFPAAFADLDADELTDVIVLSRNGSVVTVLLAHATEPLLRAEPAMQCSFPGRHITR
jgi:hypothetical protein